MLVWAMCGMDDKTEAKKNPDVECGCYDEIPLTEGRKDLLRSSDVECGCYDEIPLTQERQWLKNLQKPKFLSNLKSDSKNQKNLKTEIKTAADPGVICLCDTDGEFSKTSPNDDVICECNEVEENSIILKTTEDSETEKILTERTSKKPGLLMSDRQQTKQPLDAENMRNIRNIPMPPQAPPVSIEETSVRRLTCDWIDYKKLMKIRSEMSIETSGFKACKRKPKPPPVDRSVELNFEEAVVYYTSKNPHLFRDLVQQSLQDPIDNNDKINKQSEGKKGLSRTRRIFSKFKPKAKQSEPVPPPKEYYKEFCECPYGCIPPPTGYIPVMPPKELAKLYPKGFKLHLGGKGSLSRGLADIMF
ncbi:hypothetical protein HF086_002648 [Spodoptera exigua]|uniref:Uncharacterized protein n=1 Tax=Spodoptera exigua TaxID=7107 RepID=A0A922M8S9_SPOEX|nr:hypothetical protein HF086_002648 [Spodoptera exigua]